MIDKITHQKASNKNALRNRFILVEIEGVCEKTLYINIKYKYIC